MMNHSRTKPTSAPSFVVTISSPDPTIDAVMINPGPICRMMAPAVGREPLAACGQMSRAERHQEMA